MVKMVKKVLIYATNGPDNPEKAVLLFITANAAFVHDAEVYVCLAGPGVWWEDPCFFSLHSREGN